MDALGTIAVIGGGPAGLRAAEVAAAGGAKVTVFDARASVGRKFLVAGVGGLNLTKDEPVERFVERYSGGAGERWRELIEHFGPEALRDWARKLGVETFVASSGRVYPTEMKSAPLLRRWVQRLRTQGVRFKTHHRWIGFAGEGAGLGLKFNTPIGEYTVEPSAAVLGMGGASWPATGSDGQWVPVLEGHGVEVETLASANCGWEVAWPPEVLTLAEGKPLKNITARVEEMEAHGELLITRYGLEGGVIYQLGAVLRKMSEPAVVIDFKPGLSEAQLMAKLGPARRNFLEEARQRWRLGDAPYAVLAHHPDRDSWNSAAAIVRAVKQCRIALRGPRPIAEAISTAGGVRWAELDGALMICRLPGVFVAGEMIDWEAPTGGYLMQGCFATGTRAAEGALGWLSREES